MVYFDADKLEKIVTNLLSNAFMFTPEGGNIAVSARLLLTKKQLLMPASSVKGKESKINTLELTVKDYGMGIPKDRLARVLDHFYQTDNPVIAFWLNV